VETATLNVQYGTIQAPIGGLIGDTLVPVGGLVNPNAAQSAHYHRSAGPDLGAIQVSEAQYLSFMGQKAGRRRKARCCN